MTQPNLPPEVTSEQMHDGSGSDSLRKAADSWDKVAADCVSAAGSFSSVTSGLVDQWQGSAAAAMTGAVAAGAEGLRDTAAGAALTATQIRAIVAAFETARAATVAPETVADNRQQMRELVSSDPFGFHAPLIASVEGEYARMWEQNAAAREVYYREVYTAAGQITGWEVLHHHAGEPEPRFQSFLPNSHLHPGGNSGGLLAAAAEAAYVETWAEIGNDIINPGNVNPGDGNTRSDG